MRKKTEYVLVTQGYCCGKVWKPEDGEKFESIWECDEYYYEYIAEDAAEYYFNNCDGWESSWPVEIEIFYQGKSLGRFDVEMESVPQFSATSVKKVNDEILT